MLEFIKFGITVQSRDLSVIMEIMVSKVEEAMKRNKQMQPQAQNQQQQLQKQIQCNKGKAGKFKRSSSNLEEDGASSAILFLACIACSPSYA
ncbi:hypothetical protein GmHk_17G048612 [Glycine max]|nr:hypothetical protein GmHk_17G048612 [Glycine max]